MKARKISNNLVQITRHKFVNCYLVREDENQGYILVDTLTAGSAEKIVEIAGRYGPIRRVVLTHGHFDHAGSLDEITRILPDAEVLCSVREARLIAGDLSLDVREPHTNIKGAGRLGGFPTQKTRPDRLLANGAYVGPLRVIASPGHTPGHISLLDVRDGTLLAGDAYKTMAGVATAAVVDPAFPIPGMATWNQEFAYQSALQLRAFAPQRLATGHGPVVERPVAKMDEALREAEEKLRAWRAA